MTRIQLEDYGYISVAEGTSFPLTFNVQDVANPESTASSYSKDITIIGDKETNKIFTHAYDVNIVTGSFNVNKKVACNVIQDNVNVFENAFFQLISVEKTGGKLPNGDDEIKYTGRVKSNLLSFFTELKNQELTDLQLFAAETTLTAANIKSSFSNDVTDKFKFIPHFSNGTIFNVNQFKPAIYVQTYWDAIHEQNGFVYEFNEISGISFDKLLIPSTDKFTASEQLEDRASVIYTNGPEGYPYDCRSNTTDDQWKPSFKSPNRIHVTTLVQDDFDQWDNSFYEFQAAFPADWNFRFIVEYSYNINNPDVNPLYLDGPANSVLNIQHSVKATKLKATTNVVLGSTRSNSYTNQFNEGATLAVGNNVIATGSFTYEVQMNTGTNERVRLNLEERWTNADGSTDTLLWRNSVNDEQRAVCPTMTFTSVRMEAIPKIKYEFGTPVYINEFVPKKVKQRDFIKSIIDVYNLVVEVDPKQENKLIYKTRDKFYDEGEEKIWTNKIDIEKPHKLEWIQNKQPKNLILSYKPDDKDMWNEAYTNQTQQVYGEFDFRFENEYNVGEDRNELIFSPTPVLKGRYNGMFLPSIEANPDKPYNIRLLFDGGLRNGSWFFENADGSIGAVESSYPLALHLNDPINPTFDLNYGQCAFYFINDYTNFTQNNVWNLFHRRRFSQLSNGRILTAFFRLTPTDILNFNLNDKIFIKDAAYNVNKIIDYNANNDGLTKVELVTVDEGIETVPVPFRFVAPPLGPVPIGGVDTPNTGNGGTGIGDIGNTGVIIRGTRNTIRDGKVGTKETQDGTTVVPTKITETKVVGDNNDITTQDTGNVDVKGDDNIIITKSTTEVYGDKNVVENTESPSMVIGDNNKLSGKTSKLIVGDDLIGKEGSDIFTSKVEANQEVQVGGFHIESDGTIEFDANYYEGEYYDTDGYYITGGTGMSFGSDEIVFNATTVDMSNVTNLNLNGVIISGGNSLVRISRVSNATFNPADFPLDVFLVGIGSPQTINLPLSVDTPNGTKYTFKDWSGVASTNNITINGSGGELIDGAGSYVLDTNYDSVTVIVSDAIAGWSIVTKIDGLSGMTDSYTTDARLVGNTIEFDNNIEGVNFYNVDLSPALGNYVTIDTTQTITGNKTFNSTVVINEDGADRDFRVEGDTDTNLLFTDASADRVGIGTTTPSEKLEVAGNIKVTGTADVDKVSFDGGTTKWVFKEIQIGDWNMDTTTGVNVTHGLSSTEWKTVRGIDVLIRNDADTEYISLGGATDGGAGAGSPSITSTQFSIARDTSGFFDSVNFDSTSYNRGWVTFWYKKA